MQTQYAKSGGGTTKINPQDFADRIRALPILGDECDCLIYFNNTKPASKYGGTWQELPQGTFLRAGGTSGTTKSGTSTDGGSNTHTLTVEEMPSHRHELAKNANTGTGGITDDGRTIQRGYAGGSRPTDWTTIYDGTGNTGGGKPFDNQPLYKNCHIWRKIS